MAKHFVCYENDDDTCNGWTFVERTDGSFSCHEASQKFSVDLVVTPLDNGRWKACITCGDLEIPSKTYIPCFYFVVDLQGSFTSSDYAGKAVIETFKRMKNAFNAFDNPRLSDYNKDV